jgi:lysylphosphatidylglycerol synthetase-like protein (DUF2156 family)
VEGSHLEGAFDAYYLVGFGPTIVATLVWLGLRHRGAYKTLRTWLLVSLALASVLYLLVPTAPPRLVPGLDIGDTVGLAAHDTGSFLGVRFNPYAAMPSMHVGWSVLLAIVGYRATSSRLLRSFFVAHPLLMAITVTATGNHYFVDSIAGATAALVAVTLVALYRRSRTSASGVRQARIEPAAA